MLMGKRSLQRSSIAVEVSGETVVLQFEFQACCLDRVSTERGSVGLTIGYIRAGYLHTYRPDATAFGTDRIQVRGVTSNCITTMVY